MPAKMPRAACLGLLLLLPVAAPAAPRARLMSPGDVDRLTDALWSAAGVTPAPISDDPEFLRRVTIDVIGRIPTPEEAERFFKDPAPDKRTRLVDQLLASPAYAEHWGDVSLDLFVGREFRKPGLERRLDPRAFFVSAFRENRPYDRMAREMITFSGEIQPNGPGVFVASHVKGGGAETMASITARLFLGVQIQCAQCHDHPYDDRYKQEDFYGLVAYFARTKTKQERIAAASLGPAAATSGVSAAKVDAPTMAAAGVSDMAAPAAKDGTDGKIYTVFDKPNGQAKFKKSGADQEIVVQPRFFGRQIPPLPGEGRRDTLARAVVTSDLFAKTFVDRTWSQLFGRGIVEPWDDLGGEHDPKHPALLTGLADDFRASGYDVKHLLRLLVLSHAYSLTSRVSPPALAANSPSSPSPSPSPPPPAVDPTLFFARAPVRRLTPEELFRSLITATGVDRVEQLDADKIQKRIDRALKEYLFLFADEEMAEVNTFNGNIPQALLLFNGELTNQGARARPGATLARILAASNDPATRLRQIYLATYTRPPTAGEQERLLSKLGGDQAPRAYEDLFFALLTSTEMLTNH
jgi:Protein of unknown function (DUF1549)/Protein of unknown function (DUF1553)